VSDPAALEGVLPAVGLTIVLLSGSALAQGIDNLAFMPGAAASLALQDGGDLLPDGMTLPGPESFDCPANPALRYDGCAGARLLADGSFYQGGFANDLPHGVGRLREADGSIYIGEFEEGRRHGFGRLFDRDGNELYAGNWRDGLPDDPQGTYAQAKGIANLIRALQTELNRNGCEAGAVDGIVGPRTRGAAAMAVEARPELLLAGDPFGDVRQLLRLWQALKVASNGTCL
jgi:hypothetical protein